MKRLLILIVAFVLATPLAVAQQPPVQQPQPQAPAAKPPKPLDPADVETLTGRPYGNGQAEPAPKVGHPLNGEPAPKKGHPLDWRDVDILTGKTDRYARSYRGTYAPYIFVDVPVTGSRFGATRFTAGSTQISPLFTPRVFGRFSAQPFTVVGTTRNGLGQRFFFVPRSAGRSSVFLFP